MKKINWKRLSFLLATVMILTGNLIGIRAMATDEGGSGGTTGDGDAPDGVLVGYMAVTQRIKTGEHIERWGGWVGVPFAHLVTDYSTSLCCLKTYRAMDGCKGLPVCMN